MRIEPWIVHSAAMEASGARERVRDALLTWARRDPRVTAAAIVGSEARGEVDRWSDVDVTVAVDGDLTPVLDDWTRDMVRDFDAQHLFDLPHMSSVYRVFLLPDNLQVDVSFTPRQEFGALGPWFRLVFGEAHPRPQPPPPDARRMLGLAAHHLVRARVCIERGRALQAEYWISAGRDEALGLAALRHGSSSAHGRGFDALPSQVRATAVDALVRGVDAVELRRALHAALGLVQGEAEHLGATALAQRLGGLTK
jgi:hypothetical protein